MIKRILPDPVIAVEAFSDDPAEPVFPGEEDLVARVVPARRREFVTTRRCARAALAGLGHEPAPLRIGPRREPLWPAGVVGSLTHCTGYRAAAVAARDAVAAVGIDAEEHAALPDGVLRLVASAAERAHLAALAAADPGTHYDRVLFSAKESVYKAWYPLHGTWLGFDEATLRLNPDDRSWTARISGGRGDFTGSYLAEAGLVLTSTVVAAPSR